MCLLGGEKVKARDREAVMCVLEREKLLCGVREREVITCVLEKEKEKRKCKEETRGRESDCVFVRGSGKKKRRLENEKLLCVC